MAFYYHDKKMEMMKAKAVAVLAGALVTLILWATAIAILDGVHHGNFPWLLSAPIALLRPLLGGYVICSVRIYEPCSPWGAERVWSWSGCHSHLSHRQ